MIFFATEKETMLKRLSSLVMSILLLGLAIGCEQQIYVHSLIGKSKQAAVEMLGNSELPAEAEMEFRRHFECSETLSYSIEGEMVVFEIVDEIVVAISHFGPASEKENNKGIATLLGKPEKKVTEALGVPDSSSGKEPEFFSPYTGQQKLLFYTIGSRDCVFEISKNLERVALVEKD